MLVCGSERSAGAHEFRKVAVDDAVALLDGIVACEDVLGVVAAKWQVKGVALLHWSVVQELTTDIHGRGSLTFAQIGNGASVSAARLRWSVV